MTAAAPRRDTGWIWWAVGLMSLALVLGMAQAWFNMERMELAYELSRGQAMLADKLALGDKLEVEHGSLLASHRLRSMAGSMGLEQAGPGRIRVLDRGDGIKDAAVPEGPGS